MKKICIIGTSAAGIAAASTLRILDKECSITCFSQESEIPYNKCFLADYIAQRKTLEQLYLKPEDFFINNDITLQLNSPVDNINRETKTITSGDKTYEYDLLFLAMGSRARQLPLFAQKQWDNCFNFYSLADIQKIVAYIKNNNVKNIVLVGAGLTGLECADALLVYNPSLTIVEKNDYVLSSLLDKKSAEYIQEQAQKKGVTIFCNQIITDFAIAHNSIKNVTLSDKKHLAVDMIIVALGPQPNSQLAQNAGLNLQHDAIVVNDYLQTSDPFIFAGGDLIVTKNTLSKSSTRSATWPDAMAQGTFAARNMAGVKVPYPGITTLLNSYFFGIEIAVGGLLAHQAEGLISRQLHSENSRMILYCQDNKLKGFMIIAPCVKIALVKRWLLTQEPIDISLLGF